MGWWFSVWSIFNRKWFLYFLPAISHFMVPLPKVSEEKGWCSVSQWEKTGACSLSFCLPQCSTTAGPLSLTGLPPREEHIVHSGCLLSCSYIVHWAWSVCPCTIAVILGQMTSSGCTIGAEITVNLTESKSSSEEQHFFCFYLPLWKFWHPPRKEHSPKTHQSKSERHREENWTKPTVLWVRKAYACCQWFDIVCYSALL
jgi:hypothetical protein